MLQKTEGDRGGQEGVDRSMAPSLPPTLWRVESSRPRSLRRKTRAACTFGGGRGTPSAAGRRKQQNRKAARERIIAEPPPPPPPPSPSPQILPAGSAMQQRVVIADDTGVVQVGLTSPYFFWGVKKGP